MKLSQGNRLLFIGDSVTDVGRERPVAQGTLFNRLGRGYPHIVSGMVNALHPELGINVINTGVSGDTARRLAARWQTDVIDLHPDWLSVMIGINDVWRQFDSPCEPEEHVLLDEYESTLDELFTRTRPLLSGGLVVMAPFYIETNLQDRMRAEVARYQAACRRLAEKHHAIFVDTQAPFDRILQSRHSSFISWDRVHPNDVGHTALAMAFLRAMEFDFEA